MERFFALHVMLLADTSWILNFAPEYMQAVGMCQQESLSAFLLAPQIIVWLHMVSLFLLHFVTHCYSSEKHFFFLPATV